MKKFKRLIALVSTVAMAVSTFVPFMTAQAATESSNLVTATETLVDLQFDSEADAEKFTYRNKDGETAVNPNAGSSYSIADGALLYSRGTDDNFIQVPFSKAIDLEGEDVYKIKMRAKVPAAETWRFMALVNLANDATYTTNTWQKLTSNYLALRNSAAGFSLDDVSYAAHGGLDYWTDVVITYDNGGITLETSYTDANGETYKNTTTTTLLALTGTGSHAHRAGTLYDALMIANISAVYSTAMYFDYITVEREYQYDPYTLLDVDFEEEKTLPEDIVSNGSNVLTYWGKSTVAGPGWDVSNPNLAFDGQIVFRVLNGWTSYLGYPLSATMTKDSKKVYKVSYDVAFPWNYNNAYTWASRYLYLGDSNDSSGAWADNETDLALLRWGGNADSASAKIYPQVLGQTMTNFVMEPGVLYHAELVLDTDNGTFKASFSDDAGQQASLTGAIPTGNYGWKDGVALDKFKIMTSSNVLLDNLSVTVAKDEVSELPETDGEYIAKLTFNDAADADLYTYMNGSVTNTEATPNVDNYATMNTTEGYLHYRRGSADNYINVPLSESINLEGNDVYQIQTRVKMPAGTTRFLALVNTANDLASVTTYGVTYGKFAAGFLTLQNTTTGLSLDGTGMNAIGGETYWTDIVVTFNKGNIKLETSYTDDDGNEVKNATTTTLAALTANGSFKHRAGTTYDKLMFANISKTFTSIYFDYIAVVKNPTLPVENFNVQFVDWDGTVLSEQEVTGGYAANAPADPVRDGYIFTGWDKDFSAINADTTITAQYKEVVAGQTVTIADYDFDDINNTTGITGLMDYKTWISSAGYLSVAKNDQEVPVFLQLDEAIDLSKDFVYTVETMVKVPTVNYRWMALSNIVKDEVVYQAMVNHFLLARHDDSGVSGEKGITMAQYTSPIASATDNEWRKLTYTFTKDTYIFEAIVYNEDGTVKSDEAITGSLASLTGGSAGNGHHYDGKKYSQVAFGNINGGTTYVDYVKVTRLAPSETTPIMTELAFADGAGNTMSYASPRTAAAKAVFSQPMDIASFTEDTFVVTNENGEIIEGNGSLSEDKLTYTYTFDNALALGGKITVKATNGLKSLEDEYVAYGNRLSFDVINHIDLLNVDYDNNTMDITEFFAGNTPYISSIETDEDGNNYLYSKSDWGGHGYFFSRAIAYNETNTYRFKFDFKLNEVAAYTSGQDSYISLHDTKAAYTNSADQAYNNLNLLGIPKGKFVVANKIAIPGDPVEFGVWYSYELILKRDSGAYEVKITKRGDPEVVAGGSGLITASGEGGLHARNYNSIKLNRSANWYVDNIVVEQVVDTPVVVSAKTSKVGNIYGTNDDIVFDVTIANDSSSVVNAKVDYTVTDFDGNVIETGTVVGSQDIPELGSFGKRITITNAKDFDVYEIHFNTKAYVIDDDEEFDITSLKYMFSRVNTKAANAPTNKFLAVNQSMSVGQGDEFAKMMADAGIGGVRTTFNWHHFEKLGEEGKSARDPQYDLARHLKNNDIDVMAIFTDLNPNYTITYGNWEENVEDIYIKYMNGDCTQIEWDRAYNAFLAHVRWLVAEYADEIDYWEVFNESYSRMYHPAEDYTYEITAEHYLETYVKPVKAIVDELDPTAEVVGICTDGVMFEFVSSCIKHMGNNWPEYLDSISVHPYDWAFDNVNYRSGLAGTFGTWSVIIRDYQFEYLVDRIQNEWMEEYITNGTKIPVHYTEIGLASTKGYASFRMQAAELVQINAFTQGRDYAESIWWYNFENRDVRGDDWSTDIFNSSDPRNGNYGWIGHKNDTVPYAAKPIYVAAAAYNKFLTNAEVKGMATNGKLIEWYQNGFVTNYRGNDEGMARAVGFTATNGDDILVIWNDELTNEVLVAGWGELKVYDMFGNLIGTHNCGANGESPLTITSSFEPVYVVGALGDKVMDRVSFDSSDITVVNAREEVVVGHEYTITITDAKKRNLTLDIEASPYVNIVENNGFVDGVATIKVIPTANAEEEEKISIKVMNGNDMVHYVNGYVDVVKATYGNITANDTKISAVNGFDVIKNADILTVQLHADNLLRFNSTLNVNVLVAYYDENGALLETDELGKSFDMSGLSTLDVPVSVPENCARIKVMLWDATGLMMPYDFALDYID